MKKHNKLTVIISLMVALSVVICGMAMTASATDGGKNYYYLDSVNGDDANSGTDIDSPVKTINLSRGIVRLTFLRLCSFAISTN